MATQPTIPVDEATKEAYAKYCKDNDLKLGAGITKWMKEKGYLNKDGSLKVK